MRSIVLALVLLVLPGLVSAQVVSDDTKYVAFGSIGFDPPLSGKVTSAVTGTLTGAPLVLGNVSFGDVYGSLLRWQVGGGYRLNDRAEVVARFARSSRGGSRARLGVTPGDFDAIVGEFESISENLFQVGYRYHLARTGRIRPFLNGWGGFVRSNSINATLSRPNSAINPIDLPVLDASSAAAISGGGGLLLPLTPRLALSAEADFQWRTALNSANVLVGTGLDDIGEGSARWSLPVVFGVVLNVGPERIQ